jgi:hypothetical protein
MYTDEMSFYGIYDTLIDWTAVSQAPPYCQPFIVESGVPVAWEKLVQQQ